MNDILSFLIFFALGAVVVQMLTLRWSPRERIWVQRAFALRIVATLAMVGITLGVYGSGDIVYYQNGGAVIARMLDLNFARTSSEVISLFLQQPSDLPGFSGAGTSTSTMHALAGLIQYATGQTLVGLCAAGAVTAFLGELLLLSVFRNRVQPRLRVYVIACILMMPSVVFWSSGFLKEAFAMGGLGLTVFGAAKFALERRRLFGAITFTIGAFAITLFKAYILLAVVAAAATAYFFSRWFAHRGDTRLALAPLYLVVAALFAIGMTQAIGVLAPRFAISNLAEQTATLQSVAIHTRGGSNFNFGDGEKRAFSQQATFVPLALVNATLRPSLLDIRSPLMAVSAIETTVLTLLLLWLLSHPQIARTRIKAALRQPEWVFSAVFVVVLGIGIGMATTNLGTLVRYRVPLMPFYALSFLFLFRPIEVKPSYVWRRVVAPRTPALARGA